jgi:hypothetical protein
MTTSNDTQIIGINMEIELADEIERQAHAIHLSPADFCSMVLADWLASSEQLELADK